jgi:carboxyl-terminal processing protease
MRRAGGLAAVVLLLAGAFALGFFLTRSPALIAAPVSQERPAGPAPTPADEVRAELAASYYRPVGNDVLTETSVAEILEALGDPNTAYLSASEYEALKHRTAKSYSGIGLTVEPSRAGLLVTSALNGPAKRAGIQSGDVIIRIDGRPAGHLTFDQSVALMKGEKGTVVHLAVRRKKEGELRFTVVRREIALPSLKMRLGKVAGHPIGYLRLLSFPDSTARRLERATAELVERGAEGVVLDLRGNPGGLLAEAVQAVSIFVEDGIVCTTAGVHQDVRVYEVTGRASYPTLPLVVLVDRGSASASEIVAAALQEHDRTAVVGRRTYGKASVQSIRPLSHGTALKLTTALYRTPDGSDLTHVGVRPDRRAFDDPLTRPDEALAVAKRILLRQLSAA